MLRISTLSAWAQLEIASTQQTYLRAVVDPYRAKLVSLWVALLRDFAVIRVDPEFLHDTPLAAIDSSYSSLGREVLLPVRLYPCTVDHMLTLVIPRVLRQGLA
jgi:hypothetical protein